jgi:phosphatidylserine/phosphatidylglycerophosphate/cardiolipin synthase-like enzyme
MKYVHFVIPVLVAAIFSVAPLSLHAETSHPGRALILKNREYGEALLQGIRTARTSISCAFYLFKISGSRNSHALLIADELIRARKRGVAVTVLLERDSGTKDRLSEENRQTGDYLSRGGVMVSFDSPTVVTHAKVVVVDGRYVYLGSHNLTQSALRHNNELSVRIDSPELAAEVAAYLEKL